MVISGDFGKIIPWLLNKILKSPSLANHILLFNIHKERDMLTWPRLIDHSTLPGSKLVYIAYRR